MISIGATRYTPYGETHFLQAGDSSIVVVYDGSRYSASEIMQMATTHEFSDDGMSVLIQQVTIL